MKRFTVVALLLGVLPSFAAEPPTRCVLSIADCPAGSLPAGWNAAKALDAPGSRWEVVDDATAPGGTKALAQVSAAGRGRQFNLCVADAPQVFNLEANVAFKAVAGKEDQGGGLVWRYRDAKNYYLCRMNPLENNFRVYKVVDGKRIQLATADATAAAGTWHSLGIVHRGKHIVCHLDGKAYLDVQDDTFSTPGKIGLWTKADAQTRFAALQAQPLPE